MPDESSLENLTPQQREALKVGSALLGNKEIRRDVQRLFKKAVPTAVIPELEAEEQIAAARAEDAKRLDKIEAENMELRVANRVSERKEQCKKEGLDYDDVCKKVVDEKCSFETAIRILLLEQQTAEPGPGDVRHGPGAGNPTELLPGQEFRKAGGNISALRRVSANVASEMIDQMRGRKRPAARS